MHRRMDYNVVILDTAGRLHVDEDMMAELDSDMKETCWRVHRPFSWSMP